MQLSYHRLKIWPLYHVIAHDLSFGTHMTVMCCSGVGGHHVLNLDLNVVVITYIHSTYMSWSTPHMQHILVWMQKSQPTF